MNTTIIVGSSEGTYSVTNGARTITLMGLSWTLQIEELAYIYNRTQDLLYYAPAMNVALCTLSAGVITINSTFPVLVTGDEIHIQLYKPNQGFENTLDANKTIVENPQYGHYTSVETLVSEDDPVGTNLSGDTGCTATTLVDVTGAFTVASTAVGYLAWNITEGTSAIVSAVDSTTQITTGAGVTDWSSDLYQLPLVKRYEINAEGYNLFSLHYRLTAVANQNVYLKIYGTLDASATVDADTNWVNLSTQLLGASTGITQSGAGTIEDIVVIDAPTTMLKYMVKLVIEKSTTGAPSGSLFTVFVKKSS